LLFLSPASLPAIHQLQLIYTSASTNLCPGETFVLTNHTFIANIPADCVFTLVSPAVVPEIRHQKLGTGLLLSWPTNFSHFVPEYNTNLAIGNWSDFPVTPFMVNGQYIITSSLPNASEFFRLRQQ
jgi:hypothetical protein